MAGVEQGMMNNERKIRKSLLLACEAQANKLWGKYECFHFKIRNSMFDIRYLFMIIKGKTSAVIYVNPQLNGCKNDS